MARLVDEQGKEIREGDIIVDFRNRSWRFQMVSRDPGFTNGGLDYSGGKIMVTALEGDLGREFYPSVFDLKFVD